MSKSLDDSEFKILSSGPSPQIPPPKTLLMHFKRIILNIAINIVVIIGSPYLVYVFSRKWDIVNAVINKAKASSIKQSQEYKNKLLIDRIWSQPIGKLYFDAVEYQRMEGWCCSTTVRSILKSIPAIKTQDIPEAKSGPATVAEFATKIDGDGRDKWIKSNVVLGSEGYDTFVQCLKEKVNDTRFRVAVNFLRSPLFGFKSPWWFPMNAVLGTL